MRVSSRFVVVVVPMLLALLGSACQAAAVSSSTSSAQIPQITLKAKDFSFEGPKQVEAGLVSITMENDGKEEHHAQLLRLNDGVTMDQVQEAMKKGPEAALAMVSTAGGPSIVMPGKSQQVTLDLAEGQYLIVCLISGQDNVPHLAKGMVAPLQVTARTSKASVAEPKADASVTLKDFKFDMPTQVKAGKYTWKVVNDGPQPHEMAIVKLASGKTMQDVEAFMQSQSPSGPPPFEAAGGLQALDAGKTGWVTLDLTSGTYLALCFVPDPGSGKPHVELGMVQPFTVS